MPQRAAAPQRDAAQKNPGEPTTASPVPVGADFGAKGGVDLPGLKLKENESFEGALKRLKKQCEKAGLMYELRKRERYEKPSVRKKKKAMAARKRALKKLRAAR